MSTKSILTKFGLIAAVLTVAAFAPDKTIRALEAPSRISSHFDQAWGKQMSLLKWRGIEKGASEGEAEAIYQLGRAHKMIQMSHLTGIEPDEIEGNRLIRKAALLGHSWALLNVWKIDGENPSELLDLSKLLRQKEAVGPIFGELEGWLQWYSTKTCNADLLNEASLYATESAKRYSEVTAEGILSARDILTRQNAIEAMFIEQCSLPVN